MISFFCVLIGLYIVIDAIYLAKTSTGEDRLCTLSKYAGAFMAGLYLLVGQNDEIHMLLGLVILLFMWPDTYYRMIDLLQKNSPMLYHKFLMYFEVKPRRKTDK